VLFVMRSTVYVRNFESTLRLLAERGHQVQVVAEPHQQLDATNLIGRLCSEYAGITYRPPPESRAHAEAQLGLELRRGLDYLRYLEREYQDAPKLRRRAEHKAPAYVVSPGVRRLTANGTGRDVFAALLRAGNRAVDVDPDIEAFVRDARPDLVLVTPLVEPGSPQSDYLRAARAVGARTGLCVYSWDNLTNKGLIHDRLDVVTVWNQAMKDEAVRLHGVPADRVVITGAPAYDHWFTWTRARSRESFCREIGLDPSKPYVLYLCSSKFIAPNERPFIRRWISELRLARPELCEIGILVRPHPQNPEAWRNVPVDDLVTATGRVAVWPGAGANPVDAESRAGYFESIYHAAAVVGVNTSAQIESAIIGRGVFTLLTPEFADTQEGTLHFRHLREVNGGLLTVAGDMQEHAAQLAAALRDPAASAQRCQRFVGAFVRPFGRDIVAASRLVDALEAVAARGPAAPVRGPWWRPFARPLLKRAAQAIAAAEQAAPRRRRPTYNKPQAPPAQVTER
jgi:hypothetical protein